MNEGKHLADYFVLCFFAIVISLIILWLFGACIVIQCVYALLIFGRVLSLRDTTEVSPHTHMVSVVICAKNEANNLWQHLPAILTQRYMNEAGKPLYEVIVVNDVSSDDSAKVLSTFMASYPHLKVVTITKEMQRTAPGKKFALSQGIAAASTDWIVVTDADCMPASQDWLTLMVQPLYEGKQIVAGYGGYYENGGLLNMFIRTETVHTFMQYSTYALAGAPYMAVGRNMAYTKDIYEQAIKTDAWYKVPSGDDDFVVNIAGNKRNIAVVSDEEAFTYSAAKESVKTWMQQKQRHFSTSKYYQPWTIFLLSLYAATHAGMWLLFFVALFVSEPVFVVILMTVRCFIYWSLLAVTTEKLKENKLISFIPLFDLGWMIYNFVFAPYIIWKNKRQWK